MRATRKTRKRTRSETSLTQRGKDYAGDERIWRRERKLNLVSKEKDMAQRIIQDNNGWNTELEMIVANIGEKAAGFKWMHKKAASFYNRLFQWIGILNILLQIGAGTGAVTQINTCESVFVDTDNAVLIVVGIFMYVTAAVTAINQFKNWGSRSINHKQAQSNYAALEHNIRIMLGIYRKDRQQGKDYAEWISKEFDDLTSSTPSIPGKIQRKYRVLVDNSGKKIAVDNDITTITIKKYNNGSSNNNSSSSSGSNGSNDSLEPTPPSIVTATIVKESETEYTHPFVPSTSLEVNRGDKLSMPFAHLPVTSRSLERRKSALEMDICEEPPRETIIDIESPFEKNRYKYEVERFLDQ